MYFIICFTSLFPLTTTQTRNVFVPAFLSFVAFSANGTAQPSSLKFISYNSKPLSMCCISKLGEIHIGFPQTLYPNKVLFAFKFKAGNLIQTKQH